MTMELIYECPKCKKRYYCEAGYYARLDCKHLLSDENKEDYFYPVKIIGWRKKPQT